MARAKGDLDGRSQVVLRELCAAFLDDEGDQSAQLVAAIGERFALLPPEPRAQLLSFLRLLDSRLFWLVRTGVPRGFCGAERRIQLALLDNLARSRVAALRVGYQAFRQVVLGVHYSSERSWRLLGYEGPVRKGAFAPTLQAATSAGRREVPGA